MQPRRPSRQRSSASAWLGCLSRRARNPFSKRWLVSVPENSPSSLAGKRIVITRAAEQSEALAQELSSRGALPIVLPLVSFAGPEDFAPLDQAFAEMEQFDWLILTSAQATRAIVQRASDLQRSLVPSAARLRVACVGPVSAEAARNAKLPVEYVAVTHNGVG